eukprot:CAMPEP_0175123362 /NCGR_PEP_ID=MMETSP0087-20121206/2205_1 /TAXON_ID=136419 /ORGANISM="Unknown Unknown, Strain D1" /LENGTH=989 /DNA_ID=CAMNT_0016405053 /DNA_START=545 /DNA_END=3514 /DNA_ORIENTATION=+
MVMFSAEDLSEEFMSILSVFGFSGMIGNSGGSETTFCYQATPLFNMFVSLFQPVLSFVQLMLQAVVMLVVHRIKKKSFRGFHTSNYRRATLALFVTSYYATVKNSVRLLICQDIGDDSYLAFQPAIRCSSSEYQELQVASIVILSVIILVQIFFWRTLIKSSKLGLLDPEVSQRSKTWLFLKDVMDNDNAAVKSIDQTQENGLTSVFNSKTRKKAAESARRGSLSEGWSAVKKSNLTKEEFQKEMKYRKIRTARYKRGLKEPWIPVGFPQFRKSKQVWRDYGALMMPYKVSCYYWEFYSMCRRGVVIVIALSYVNSQPRFFAFGVVTILQLIAQSYFQPYRETSNSTDPVMNKVLANMNNFEMLSLSTLYFLVQLSASSISKEPTTIWIKFALLLFVFGVLFSALLLLIYRSKVLGSKFAVPRFRLEELLGQVDEEEDDIDVAKLNKSKKHLKQDDNSGKQDKEMPRQMGSDHSNHDKQVLSAIRNCYNDSNGRPTAESFNDLFQQLHGSSSPLPSTLSALAKLQKTSSGRCSYTGFVNLVIKTSGIKLGCKYISILQQLDVAGEELLREQFSKLGKGSLHVKLQHLSPILNAAGCKLNSIQLTHFVRQCTSLSIAEPGVTVDNLLKAVAVTLAQHPTKGATQQDGTSTVAASQRSKHFKSWWMIFALDNCAHLSSQILSPTPRFLPTSLMKEFFALFVAVNVSGSGHICAEDLATFANGAFSLKEAQNLIAEAVGRVAGKPSQLLSFEQFWKHMAKLLYYLSTDESKYENAPELSSPLNSKADLDSLNVSLEDSSLFSDAEEERILGPADVMATEFPEMELKYHEPYEPVSRLPKASELSQLSNRIERSVNSFFATMEDDEDRSVQNREYSQMSILNKMQYEVTTMGDSRLDSSRFDGHSNREFTSRRNKNELSLTELTANIPQAMAFVGYASDHSQGYKSDLSQHPVRSQLFSDLSSPDLSKIDSLELHSSEDEDQNMAKWDMWYAS